MLKVSQKSESTYIPSLASAPQMLKNLTKIAVPIILIVGMQSLKKADGGIISGIAVAIGCVGGSAFFPTSLFFAAAPCYDLVMLATANPVIP